MGKKITYLLGAGASANTLPVVADMSTRINVLTNILKAEKDKALQPDAQTSSGPEYQIIFDYVEVLTGIIEDFVWLSRESKNYYSVDTLAKKYYLIDGGNSRNYERLKRCLIYYFTIEQFIFYQNTSNEGFQKKQTDNRYDSFIASIAQPGKEKLILNKDIRILSWNYDIQFELCLKRFKNELIRDIKTSYNILPKLYTSSNNKNSIANSFMFLKLNGNAVYSIDSELYTIFDYRDEFYNVPSSILLSRLLKDFAKFNSNDNKAIRFINFAWEIDENFTGRKHEEHQQLIIDAQKTAEETEILVVIGYSFPIFNREVDNKLFGKMINLEKVYIQDANPSKIKSTMFNAFKVLQTKRRDNHGRLRDEFKVSFQEESSLDQFVIPYELYGE